MLPAAGAVGQRAEHPGRGQPAHLGEGGDADAQLHRVVAGPPPRLLGAQPVVVEQLLGPGRGRLVVARVVGQAGHGGERELLVLDPVPLAQLQRVHAQVRGEFVHHPLDGERGLGAARAAVGVGRHLGGEHPDAAEPVRVHLVDGREHERPEERHARRDQHQVGAHVGQQVHVEAADPAVAVRREPKPLPLVAAVVHGHVAFAAGLGPLDRPAQLAGDQHGQHLFGRDLQLGPEAAARRPGAMTRMFCSGMPVTRASMTRSTCGTCVADQSVNSPPTTRADHRARLHRGRDQPLLPVGALDHDRRVAERRVQVALREDEVEALVARLVHLGRGLVQGRPHVEHRRKLLVVDLDGGQRVGRGVAVAGHDAGHRLADVAHLVHRHRRVRRDHDVRGDRPGAGQAALLGGEVRAGVGGDHARLVPGRADVHRGDPGVRVRAAEEGDVQHPGQRDVVGPVGLAGDEALVFLAQAGLAEFGGFGLGCLGRGHSLTPAWAARRTARTMFS